MSIRAIFAVAALCASAWPAWAEEPQHCGLMEATSLDMEQDAYATPVVHVGIHGSDRKMIVDTGGIYSLLKESAVKDLGLNKVPVQELVSNMFSGEFLGYAAKAEDFTIGRIRYEAYNFTVVSDAQFGKTDISGTIAPDVMSHFDAEFDFAGKKFNLFSQKHCPGAVVYWADDYAKLPLKRDEASHIYTDGKLDGQDIMISFDTGSSFSTMSEDHARAFGWDGKKESLIKVDMGGTDPLYVYPFKSLELHGITIAHPKIVAMGPKYRTSEDMILGMNVMKQLRIYIAYGERTMYVTGANAKRATAPDALPLH